jgi:hypothetical protein
MNTKLNRATEETVGVVCCQPAIRKRLFEYVVDPLRYQGAEEVEDHLLDCRDCREFVDAMIGMRAVARRLDEAGSSGSRVTRIADFRKE